VTWTFVWIMVRMVFFAMWIGFRAGRARRTGIAKLH